MDVKPAEGRLGVLVVGCGAVATTFMTGVLMARKGLAKPIGSMTQYDKIRVGHGADKLYLHYKDIIPMADLRDLVFGTWDVYPQNAYQAAVYAEVLKAKDIEPVRDELMAIKPMKAAFDKNYAKRLDGDNVKDCKTRWDMVEALRADIRDFKEREQCDRVVVIWAASTEIYVPYDAAYHKTLDQLQAAMKADDREHIAPSMCYAYAALEERCPFIMGALWTFPRCGNWQRRRTCRLLERTSRQVKHWLNQALHLSLRPAIWAWQDGSQPIFLVIGMGLFWTSQPISTPKKLVSCPPWRPFVNQRSSPIYMETSITRCVSTTILHATMTKKDGITLISLDGWDTQCRSR